VLSFSSFGFKRRLSKATVVDFLPTLRQNNEDKADKPIDRLIKQGMHNEEVLMVTALFDGKCVLCQTTRHIIKAIDWFNRVEFLDLHHQSEVEMPFPDFDHTAMMGEIHVVADNEVYAGFDGVRRMLRETPLGFAAWLIFSLPGMGWLGPKVYRFIAEHRYGINRLLGVELREEDDNCADGICKLPQAR
jgi:predicted DCC family thiol-disulfide oxidoreductase YuxK